MKSVQKGFTLIELIVVIVILGILAATALPRFINVTSEARAAAVNGVAGGLRSAVALARAQYYIQGNNAATTVTMNGQSVGVIAGASNGQPAGTAAGIGTALDLAGFTPDYTDPNAVTFRPTGGSATCQATYNASTGAVSVDVSSCS